MRYLPTSRLTPGMALGQDIYDGAGRLLLGRHILLTEEQISNLEFLGFPGVYVDDEFSRGIEIQQIVSPEVRRQALKIVYDLFHTDMRKQEPSEAEFKLRKTVESVVDDVICNGDIMCNIMDIKSYDDYIYYHSIHVGILSVVVGARLGLPHDELCQLAAAALLHDIGKRFIDHDIVRGGKAHRGEEEQEVYRSHPKIGAEYLRETCRFSADVYEGIMEHHECYNGEGYPLGKKGGEIHLFARIIRIADCYDAKVSAFPAQKSLSPSEALEYVMALGDRWFDPDIVAVFARKVAAYPIGCEVELSNGQHAVVARNFENFPLRPLVRVVETGEMLNMRDDEKARAVTVGRLIVR